MADSQTQQQVALLSLYSGYFDLLATCYALKMSSHDAVKVLFSTFSVALINYCTGFAKVV